MFKRWYLSKTQTELDQRGAQIEAAKARAAAAPGAARAEHQKLIAAAEDKGRNLRMRLEQLRRAGKEEYAQIKASVEAARDELGEAVRSVRRFA